MKSIPDDPYTDIYVWAIKNKRNLVIAYLEKIKEEETNYQDRIAKLEYENALLKDSLRNKVSLKSKYRRLISILERGFNAKI